MGEDGVFVSTDGRQAGSWWIDCVLFCMTVGERGIWNSASLVLVLVTKRGHGCLTSSSSFFASKRSSKTGEYNARLKVRKGINHQRYQTKTLAEAFACARRFPLVADECGAFLCVGS
jgi:hypothetical protein